MRNLSLKKDTLIELTSDELGGLAAASYPTKFECTVSHQVCLSVDVCIVVGGSNGCLTDLCPTSHFTKACL